MGSVKLGRTGLVVEKQGFGCLPIQRISKAEAVELLHRAYDGGMNYFDTARAYSDSEEKVGAAFAGMRDKIYIATKTGATTAEGMWKDLEQSLRMLQTDYIDGYLMHWDDRVGTPIEETIACMKELKNAGKVRFLGMSNLERDLADRLLADGVLDIVQYPYNMINRTKEDVLKYYAGQGCGTMGYGSLGGGILTGQFREVPTFGHGDMRASFYGPMFTEPGFSQIQTLLKVMDGIAETHKATVAQVAINWALAHDYMHTVLTGVGNAAEAEENCAAAAWELTVQEKQELDEAISKIHIYS